MSFWQDVGILAMAFYIVGVLFSWLWGIVSFDEEKTRLMTKGHTNDGANLLAGISIFVGAVFLPCIIVYRIFLALRNGIHDLRNYYNTRKSYIPKAKVVK